MLKKLFPRVHHRYLSLPLLGAILDGFAEFLVEQGYPTAPVCRHVRTAGRIDARLRQRGCQSASKLTRMDLRSCAPPPGRSQDDAEATATVRLLERYLDQRGILPQPGPPSPAESKVAEYGAYLQQVRGLAPATVSKHMTTASEFIAHLDDRGGLLKLPKLTAQDVESFVRRTGNRVGRGTMQHIVAQLRSFLRFLATRGETPVGLDTQIDTPCVYRGEQLPRALPWPTVRALLQAVDRSTPIGRRDYAMLLLVATYGLRTSEIVGLKLEHIEWRASRLSVPRRKTATALLLPLTDTVGDSLVDYLRRGRPSVSYREVFVRHKAPAGVLKPTAVTEVFQAWSRRSGLAIPFQGPHCLRHSYAVHLLRQGVSLKTIGDVLGHRSAESTCVYLRLAVDDLRAVPLGLPMRTSQEVL